jgi:hypothetical protein
MLLAPRKTGRGYSADFAIGLDLADAVTGDDDSFVPGGGQPSGPPPA